MPYQSLIRHERTRSYINRLKNNIFQYALINIRCQFAGRSKHEIYALRANGLFHFNFHITDVQATIGQLCRLHLPPINARTITMPTVGGMK